MRPSPQRRTRGRYTFALALALAVLTPASAFVAGPPASAAKAPAPRVVSAHRKVLLHKKRASIARAATAGPLLIDGGGPVLAHARVYSVWWGRGRGRSTFPASVEPLVTDFLQGLGSFGGSSLLQVTDQYMRGDSASVDYVKSYTDGATKVPRTAPSTTALGTEVARAVRAAGDELEPGALYLVFTPKLPTGASYCAWHSAASVDGTWIAVAYMPGLGSASGCAAPDSGSGVRSSVQALVNVLSHELLEATTDSILQDQPAWLDSDSQEIADKCAWRFTKTADGYQTQRIGSYDWVLQQEWSNARRRCV